MPVSLLTAYSANNAGGSTSVPVILPGLITSGFAEDTAGVSTTLTGTISSSAKNDLIYGDGRWVFATIDGYTTTSRRFYYADSICGTWRPGVANPNNYTPTEITYGNGYWVSPMPYINTNQTDDNIAYISNIASGSWTVVTGVFGSPTSSSSINAVFHHNGVWIAALSGTSTLGTVGQLAVSTSTPPTSWTILGTQAPTNVRAFATDGTTYVSVGNTGWIGTATSLSGPWTYTQQGTSGFNDVAYGNGYWTAVGASGALRYATNPTGTWTLNAQGTINWQTVDYGGGYWAIGGSVASSTLFGLRYKATNPTGTWTLPTMARGGTQGYGYRVRFGGGVWGAVSNTYSNTIAETYGWAVAAPTAPTGHVVSVGVRGGTGTTITDPAGWTLLGTQTNSTTNIAQKTYWIAGASAPSTTTLSFTSNKASVVAASFSGSGSAVAPTANEYAHASNAASATVTYPALGTLTKSAGIVVATATMANDAVPTAPSGYTAAEYSASTGGGSTSRTTTALAYQSLTGLGSIDSTTATWSASAVSTSSQVFIADPTASAPGGGGGGTADPFPQTGGGYYGG